MHLDQHTQRQLAVRGGPDAESRLVQTNARAIHALANRWRNHHAYDADDFFQAACLGFVVGLRHWRADGGSTPLSYALMWARSEIQKHVLTVHGIVRVGTTNQRRLGVLNAAHRLPEDGHAYAAPVSLDDLPPPADPGPDPEAALLLSEAPVLARQALADVLERARLTPRQREALFRDVPSDTLAARWMRTRQRVHQVELDGARRLAAVTGSEPRAIIRALRALRQNGGGSEGSGSSDGAAAA